MATLDERVTELEKKVESIPITPEDAQKAKKKGSLFGDPVLIIE